ncbi:hypothetical protein EV702DRAFT_525764 [Suillus placidus]|uniref:DUF6533 domain-containing protein n=1 Tax=Suillus placidus TaxID=48579 RepID=A0A9P7D0B9_9AGAM|nr:hypothetical protein EV702DRAFT_525764 [Suillus placidus]
MVPVYITAVQNHNLQSLIQSSTIRTIRNGYPSVSHLRINFSGKSAECDISGRCSRAPTKFAVHCHKQPLDMTLVSNDPSLWPLINGSHVSSYLAVASLTAVVYDWVMTFGQEFELVWRQRWSFMTVLYISVRYIGILSSVMGILPNHPSISLTDAVRTIIVLAHSHTGLIVNAMLDVIIITRLHAMYQSRKMLIFLVVIFVAITITFAVMGAIETSHISGEESILSGTHHCISKGKTTLIPDSWILGTIWEILILCLAVRIAFYESQRQRYVVVSCLTLGLLSLNWKIFDSKSAQAYHGVLRISEAMQVSVLGPRLILSVREQHNAELVADLDEGASMTSTIIFQECVDVPTGGGV